MTSLITPTDIDKICEAISISGRMGQICSVAIECDLSDCATAFEALSQLLDAWHSADGFVTEDVLDVWKEAESADDAEWHIRIVPA